MNGGLGGGSEVIKGAQSSDVRLFLQIIIYMRCFNISRQPLLLGEGVVRWNLYGGLLLLWLGRWIHGQLAVTPRFRLFLLRSSDW